MTAPDPRELISAHGAVIVPVEKLAGHIVYRDDDGHPRQLLGDHVLFAVEARCTSIHREGDRSWRCQLPWRHDDELHRSISGRRTWRGD